MLPPCRTTSHLVSVAAAVGGRPPKILLVYDLHHVMGSSTVYRKDLHPVKTEASRAHEEDCAYDRYDNILTVTLADC